MLNFRRASIALAAFVATAAGSALAFPIISNPVYRIEATNGLGSGFLDFTLADGFNPDADSFELNLMTPTDIVDTGNNSIVVARLLQATLTVYDLPDFKQMTISYAIEGFDALTTFRIASGQFSFGTVNNPDGFASAALGVTDQTEPEDGADHIANGPGGKSFHTYYNGLAPGGTLFDRLVGSFGTIPGPGSNSADANESSGWVPIVGSVSSISHELLFQLSGGDLGNGTATFGVTPEPSAFALLAVAGALFARRR